MEEIKDKVSYGAMVLWRVVVVVVVLILIYFILKSFYLIFRSEFRQSCKSRSQHSGSTYYCALQTIQ